MWEEILKAIPVFLLSMLKFILGPSVGYGAVLHIMTTIIATVAGTMTVVFAFTYFGEWIRTQVFQRILKKKETSEASKEKALTRWRKFGLFGIALITPLILTPIGGTILAVSFGSPKAKILVYMLISASFWAVVFSVAIYSFGHHVLPEFLKWQWQR